MAGIMSEINPMDEKVEPFFEVIDEVAARRYPCDSNKRGKWILFYKREYMNAMWQQALSLYRAGELTGVHSLKCSTAAPNPRTNDTTKGVIRVSCGPCDDEKLMLSYGENLVKKMKYFSDYGHMAYKTEEQTEKGTRATGVPLNFRYRIPVSTKDHLKKKLDMYDSLGVTYEMSHLSVSKPFRNTTRKSLNGKNKDDPTVEDEFRQLKTPYGVRCTQQRCKSASDVKEFDVPSLTYAKEWLYEIEDDIALQYYMELNLLGRWLMIYRISELDSAWKKACRLYRANELKGIAFLKVTTGKRLPGRHSSRTGLIACFCGPHHDEMLVHIYGRNLFRQMGYVGYHGTIDYKIDHLDKPSELLYRIKTE